MTIIEIVIIILIVITMILAKKVIDKNGPTKTGGTGIKQLRENIAESKLSYEIMDDAAQVMIILAVVFIV